MVVIDFANYIHLMVQLEWLIFQPLCFEAIFDYATQGTYVNAHHRYAVHFYSTGAYVLHPRKFNSKKSYF